ncbi:MAG: sulfite exporter TauE/SafE family protein [Sulfitobacter sp.]|uniref:sulfite exporter TauE/SafE family protein n=1 Tax=unclassified Sulfitobacter TaxID=196795 RepID=UPI0029439586|nr:sulfite exporter TauE/SafE family protein [Sulfitobacter sp. LC.270.F.C4]WOI14561.1 sulfite exporter TauE/SafE family protein [Sulfitobacter sp. LC.270.F.C4]
MATPGVAWLALAVIVAGLVRGFAGFGSAMIIMPAAASVLSPVEAILFMTAAELIGPLPNLPDALRQGSPREVGRLLLGVLIGMPLGLWGLSMMSPDGFGWIVSGVVLTLLVLLLAGWRYHGPLGARLVAATGALGGFMTGFAGIAGPPVILLYMASRRPAAVIRANFLLYLLGIDLLLFAMLAATGQVVWSVLVLGLLAGVPNILANIIGARSFDPNKEQLFRAVAYIVIAASAIIGLPLWNIGA